MTCRNKNEVLSVDIGTRYTKIYSSHQDKFYIEPSAYAKKKSNGKIIAFGSEVYKYIDDESIIIEWPIVFDRLCNIESFQFVRAIIKNNKITAYDNSIVYSKDDFGTEVEQYAFFEGMEKLKSKKLYSVSRAVANCLGEGIDIFNKKALLNINVGYDVTDISLISYGKVVSSTFLYKGIRNLDNKVNDYITEVSNIIPSFFEIEKIRRSYSLEQEIFIKGIDKFTGLVIEKTVSIKDKTSNFIGVCKQIAEEIMTKINELIRFLPLEIKIELRNKAFIITGDGAKDLGTYLENIIKDNHFKSYIVKEPTMSATKGLVKIINDINLDAVLRKEDNISIKKWLLD